jgi:hypothetical protein
MKYTECMKPQAGSVMKNLLYALLSAHGVSVPNS